jgi:hypothetical protein
MPIKLDYQLARRRFAEALALATSEAIFPLSELVTLTAAPLRR